MSVTFREPKLDHRVLLPEGGHDQPSPQRLPFRDHHGKQHEGRSGVTEQPELGGIAVAIGPGRVTAVFVGEFDEWNSGTLAAQVPAVDQRAVLLDLSGVTFASSAFLRELIGLHRTVHDGGGQFQITSTSPVVLRVLEMTGLAALLLGEPA